MPASVYPPEAELHYVLVGAWQVRHVTPLTESITKFTSSMGVTTAACVSSLMISETLPWRDGGVGMTSLKLMGNS